MKPSEKLGFAPTYKSIEKEVGWAVKITPPAWISDRSAMVGLTEDQHERFLMWRRDGGLIQNMLPELSEEDREILLTGII